MRPSSPSVLFLMTCGAVLPACSDTGVKATNSGPEAAITSHADGDTVAEGRIVALRGQAGDPDDASGSLVVTWFADGVELCPAAPATADGASSCEAALPPGTIKVSMEVVDPSGAGASDAVTLDVTPTSSPTVDITAPEAAGNYDSDRLIAFAANVADGEDRPEQLTYTLTSSLGGDLSSLLTVDSAGTVSGYLTLAEGEHALTLTAVDTTGKRGTDSVVIDVGAPNEVPTCAIVAPLDGSVWALGDEVALEATATDPGEDPSTLRATWTSDRDGAIATVAPTSDGRILATATSLSGGSHTVTLRVEDADGEACTRAAAIVVDAPPSIEITSPADGTTSAAGEVVRIDVLVSDPEDRPNELAVSWESDRDGMIGMDIADASGVASLSLNDLSIGAHVLTATVTDTQGLASVATLDLVVNGLPTAPAVRITPAAPSTTDALVASVTAPSVDPDGDPISYSYAWYVDGVLSSASTAATLPATATRRGETWEVVVTPDDGTHDGTPGTASVVIANTAPTLLTASLTPSPATVADTIACTPGVSTDIDGDTVSYRYAWTVNGVAIAGTSSTLRAPDFQRGDTLRCTVTPTDGTDDGLPVATSGLTIGNAVPTLVSAAITPGSPVPGDTLTCTASGCSDADGDANASTFAWTVNGIAAGTGATLTTTLRRGDVVVCTATPYDGRSSGTPVTASATVANRAPTVTSVTISPSTARTNDTLTATVVASDPDGDAVTNTVTWTVNGTVAGTGTTLTGSAFNKGDTVLATATPNDGATTGSAVASSAVVIANSAPTAPTLSISPSTPEAGADDLLCAVATVATDADGDRLTYQFSWTVNGAAWTGSTSTRTWTGDTIPGALTEDGDTWTCTVRATDGTDLGAAATVSVAPETSWTATRTFTNCGQTDYRGPSQAQCDSAYAGTALAGEVTLTRGVQAWTVPSDGDYRITAVGARGAAGASAYLGGRGARMQGVFSLTAGEVIFILVGQQGTGQSSESNGGGGGGTFVVDSTRSPLLVAGGGGGTRAAVYQNGCDATTSTSGTTASGSAETHSCTARTSTPGYGGIMSSSSWGAGGGGYYGDGAADSSSSWGTMGGKAFTAGGEGGEAGVGGTCGTSAHGGFGGGGTGNGCYGGGGGGGYSGGDGGRVAGGGGSYNTGTSQVNTAGIGTGHGSVTIERL